MPQDAAVKTEAKVPESHIEIPKEDEKKPVAKIVYPRHLQIEDEEIEYSGRKADKLLSLRRGANGTKVADHEEGTAVYFVDAGSSSISAKTTLSKKLSKGDLTISLESTDGFPS